MSAGSGYSLVLDGVNDYVDAGFDNRGITNQVTVEAWIKTSGQGYHWIVGKYSNTQGENSGYHLFVNGGMAAFNGRDGSGNYRSSGMSTTRVADNRWHHLAGVCLNGRWEIWVDGILENSLNTGYSNTSLTTQFSPLTIGNYYTFSENYFPGQVDEVRIWKTGRGQDDIRTYMCRKLTGTEANLVAYFPFDALGTNTDFPDLSANKKNGSLKNMPGNQAQTLSGAPIGNASEFFYQSDWSNARFEILGKHTFQLFFPSANAKGVHLYRVDSPPNTRAGITSGTSPDYYYGVFTLGSPQPITYTVNYKAFEGNNCYNLYSRKDNAVLTWGLLPTNNMPLANTLNKAGEADRGEYLLTTNPAPTLSITGPASVCSNSQVVLTAQGSGQGTYLWNTGATASSITVDKPGVYTVRYTLPGGCYSESSRTVVQGSLPPFNLGRDTLLCAGSSYRLTAPAGNGLTYKWQDGSTGSSMQVSSPGWYWLEIAQNNCTTRDSVRIAYEPKPVVKLGADTTLCAGKTLLLSAGNPGLKYRWQDNTTAGTYQVTRAGTYWVDVESLSGCLTRDSIRVVYLTPPVVNLGKDTTLCQGQSLTLNRKLPGVKYLWQDGSTQESITITRPGKYWLRSSLDVCSESDTLVVSYQTNPPLVMSGDTLMCRGGKLVLSASVPGATYRWQDGSTAPSFLVEQEGEYSVAVTLGNCTTTSTKRVSFRDCEPFIPNIITPNGDQANEAFVIRNIDPTEWSLEIFNRWGQRVYQTNRYGNDWTAKGMSDGTYFYRLVHTSRGLTYKGYLEVLK
ncbi:MAG: LamG-like jellyroll fold domain-containing protein [Adhaeribacter sp.]